MSTYAEKLKDPRWQRKRLEILSRDDWACTRCRDTKSNLQVDHIYYQRGRDPWDYPDTALQTLCRSCHEMVTEQRKSSGSQEGEWIVYSRSAVDEFDENMFRVAVGGDDGFFKAVTAFQACSEDQDLRQSPLRGECSGVVFFVFKLDNNGTTFLCARKGEESRTMEMLQVPECHWQFRDKEGLWTHEEPK